MAKSTNQEHRDLYKHSGGVLSRLRVRAGLSRAELAMHLDVTVQMIHLYENGKHPLSMGRLEELVKLFEVPVSAFFRRASPN